MHGLSKIVSIPLLTVRHLIDARSELIRGTTIQYIVTVPACNNETFQVDMFVPRLPLVETEGRVELQRFSTSACKRYCTFVRSVALLM